MQLTKCLISAKRVRVAPFLIALHLGIADLILAKMNFVLADAQQEPPQIELLHLADLTLPTVFCLGFERQFHDLLSN